MQGIKDWIPTEEKVQYIQSLLRCGFDTIDLEVLFLQKQFLKCRIRSKYLNNWILSETESKLLAIVANTRGAEEAVQHPEIQYLGYPFSISENFQMRNTHKTLRSPSIL